MPTPFAALERRVNDTVLTTLANAQASLGGGKAMPAIFDAAYILGDVGHTGMASCAPALTVATDMLPTPIVGQPVTVTTGTGTANWMVAEHHPDGAGLSVLLLERVS